MTENRKLLIDNLNEQLRLHNKKKIDIVKDLSLSKSTVFGWFNGVSYPRIEALEKLAKYFRIEVADLVGPQDYAVLVKIPVFSEINTSNPFDVLNEMTEYVEVSSEFVKSGTFFGYRIKTHAYAPKFEMGDVLILRFQTTVTSGHTYLVRLNNASETLYKLIKNDFSLTLQPVESNADSVVVMNRQIKELVEVIGMVVEVRRSIK